MHLAKLLALSRYSFRRNKRHERISGSIAESNPKPSRLARQHSRRGAWSPQKWHPVVQPQRKGIPGRGADSGLPFANLDVKAYLAVRRCECPPPAFATNSRKWHDADHGTKNPQILRRRLHRRANPLLILSARLQSSASGNTRSVGFTSSLHWLLMTLDANSFR